LLNFLQMPTALIGVIFLNLFLSACNTNKENQALKEKIISEIEAIENDLKSSVATNKNTISDLNNKSNQTVAVVKKVMPAVVSVHSEKLINVPYHQYFNPFEELFGAPRDRESKKYKQQGLGSGVLIDKKGYIITNHHVAGEADELKVTLSDDREFEAELIGTDKLSDVAVIKIKNPPENLPVAKMGNSNNLEIGETVLAIGNPFGYSNTVTSGILSAKGRTIGINSYENYLQTDASINPGNSGGALVNLNGEVIGINTAIASQTGGSHGIGFAIPINMARKLMTDLLDDGSVTRGYLGVYLQQMNKNIADALNLKNTRGALVTSVIKNSPAEKAGIEEMDVILKVDGQKIKNVNKLRNIVAMLNPNKTYKFEVSRNGKNVSFKIKIGTRDDAQVAKKSDPEKSLNHGMRLADIDEELARRYNFKNRFGVLVVDVESGSGADKSGVKTGDIIVEADRQKVKNTADLNRILKNINVNVCLIHIVRNGVDMFVGLKLLE